MLAGVLPQSLNLLMRLRKYRMETPFKCDNLIASVKRKIVETWAERLFLSSVADNMNWFQIQCCLKISQNQNFIVLNVMGRTDFSDQFRIIIIIIIRHKRIGYDL